MNRKYLIFATICLCLLFKVNAETCSLETQVAINNDAGSVSVSATPFEYGYTDNDTETGEEYEGTAYTGLVHVYNLTSNIYAVASSDNDKITLNYDENNPNQVTFSSGGMGYVKNYKISNYSTNKSCGKTAIRELNITVPRLNRYYSYDSCNDYPDYFYCSQFLTVDDISEDDFVSGLKDYAKTVNNKNDETRQEGFFKETTNFIKKHWLIIIISIALIGGGITTFVILRNKKRKEQIV